jgi:hypothetical protein
MLTKLFEVAMFIFWMSSTYESADRGMVEESNSRASVERGCETELPVWEFGPGPGSVHTLAGCIVLAQDVCLEM